MKEPVYGFPCVENPHDFIPDTDCCTEAEIKFHEDAKQRWDAGERDVRGARSETIFDSTGRWAGHVTRTSWGIGVNYVDVDAMFAESEETRE